MIPRIVVLVWLCAAGLWAAGCGEQRPPSREFFYAPGLWVNYEVHGTGETTIIALHGLGASLDSWRDILPSLERSGTVYLIDLVGYGHSSKPENFPYSVQSEANLLAVFIGHLRAEGRRHLILLGHSFGGAVALALAEQVQPEKLILIDPLVSFDNIRLHGLITTFNRGPFNRWAMSAVPARHRAWIGLRRAFKHNSQVTRERVCRYAQFLDMPGAVPAFLKTVKSLQMTDIAGGLPDVTCPVLIIWGDKDPILAPSEGSRLMHALPTAQFVRIRRCGHVPQEEWPAETAQILIPFL